MRQYLDLEEIRMNITEERLKRKEEVKTETAIEPEMRIDLPPLGVDIVAEKIVGKDLKVTREEGLSIIKKKRNCSQGRKEENYSFYQQ